MTPPEFAACPISGPILKAIEARKLTASKLARATGLNERGLRRWIKGEKDLGALNLGRVAKAVGFAAAEVKRPPGRPKPAARAAVEVIPLEDLDGTSGFDPE